MNFIKSLTGYLLLSSVIVLSAGDIQEEILVVVNSHIITSRAFQQEVTSILNESTDNNANKLHSAKEEALKHLIDSYILIDKANSIGMAIDDAFNDYIARLKEKYHIASDVDLELAVRNELGISLKAYQNKWQQDSVKNYIIQTEILPKIVVTDQELQAYYKEHEEKFKQPGSLHIRELVLPQGVSIEEKKDTVAKLTTIKNELKQGTNFETLIRRYSIASSHSTGGDLGWLNKNTLHPTLEQAIITLKNEQITDPITIDKYIYIIQLLGTKNDVIKPFAEIRDALAEELKANKVENEMEAYIQSLRIRANIRYLVPKNLILNN